MIISILTPQMFLIALKKEVYNLKSQRIHPNNKTLDPFEADLFKLIRKIRFRKYHNDFQTKLNKDKRN